MLAAEPNLIAGVNRDGDLAACDEPKLELRLRQSSLRSQSLVVLFDRVEDLIGFEGEFQSLLTLQHFLQLDQVDLANAVDVSR